MDSKKIKVRMSGIYEIQDNNYIKKDKENIFTFHFRECEIGETFEQVKEDIFSCVPCPDTYYSLEQPNELTKCKECPLEVAVQCHAKYINVKHGFWRAHDMTDSIYECYNYHENCLGGQDSFTCEKGYLGPKCEECDIDGSVWGGKYYKTHRYRCAPVDEAMNYAVGGIFFLICLAFNVVQIWLAFRDARLKFFEHMKISSFRPTVRSTRSGTLMKILMNYLYYLSLVFFIKVP